MGEVSDLVGDHGTPVARVFGPAVDTGLEEGTVDDQLTASLEQIEQARLPLRTLEEQVITRARVAGVVGFVATGTSVVASREAHALSLRHPGLIASTAGVHPHNARECDEHTLAGLRDLAGKPGVVAIGECGLDYDRDFSPRPVQRRLRLANDGRGVSSITMSCKNPNNPCW